MSSVADIPWRTELTVAFMRAVGAGITWRWVYGVACIYIGVVLFFIAFVLEETMYDRYHWPVPPRPSKGLRYRIETLIGITGLKMMKYRPSWYTCVSDVFRVICKPVVFLACLYVMCMLLSNASLWRPESLTPAADQQGHSVSVSASTSPMRCK